MAGSCGASDHILYYYSTQSLLLDQRTAQGCDPQYCMYEYDYGKDHRCPDRKNEKGEMERTCQWDPGQFHGPFHPEYGHPLKPCPPLWAELKPEHDALFEKSGGPALDLKGVVTQLHDSWSRIGELDDQCWKGELPPEGLVAMQAERQHFRRLIHRWSQLLRERK